MAFPEGFISELKMRNPLTELVGQYSSVRRAGSNTVCCCPFHSEKTPSFTIFADDHFYCFGCGAGGDVITFVMKIENIDYPSAVEKLADRCGMTLPQSDIFVKKTDTKRLYAMNASAAKFYYDKMISPEGARAREYLASRGFDLKQLTRFGLGYADGSRDRAELASHLLREGYTPEEMKTMFLAAKDKNGRLYDYFRNRVVFPVIDVSGRVIAFSGRFIGTPGPNDRKYFNTADTPVYKKSRNLYGLNIARKSKKDSLILCEGNMDAVALQAAGFDNAVAGLGTALTKEQAALISRYATGVFICYDSDEAGQRAALKAMKLLSDSGIQVKVLKLDGAKDPDEYIRKFGKNSFEKLIEGAAGQIEYRFSLLRERFDLTSMDGKRAFIDEALKALIYASPLEAEIFISKISEVTSVKKEALEDELRIKKRRAAAKEKSDRIARDESAAAGYRPPPDKTAGFVSRSAVEDNALGILILRPEYLADAKIRGKIDPELFKGDMHRRALYNMLKATENGEAFDTGCLGESLDADEVGAVTGFAVRRARLNNSPEVLEEMLQKLKERKDKTESDPDSVPLDEWITKLKEKKKGK